MTESNTAPNPTMYGGKSLELLREISTWENTTTIILHSGSVFEFKGKFPNGKLAHGFYNLEGGSGFEGHLNLNKVNSIAFQNKLHRGQESHAFVFQDIKDECIFKIFLGRDKNGTLHQLQKQKYLAYQQSYSSGENT